MRLFRPIAAGRSLAAGLLMLAAVHAAAFAEQPTVTNVFVDTFITEALQDVAFETGVNIIADTGLDRFITLELWETPLEEALALILTPGGYTFAKISENTYLAGQTDPESPVFHLLSRTESYRLQHIGAESAKRLLPSMWERYVAFDEESRTAVISAPPEIARRILDDLNRIDVPRRQIVIEALVTELSETGRHILSLDWEWNDPGLGFQQSYAGLSSLVASVGYLAPGGLDRLFVSLRNLVTEGEAHVHANPSVTALDGEQAEIFVGKERYFRIETGSEQNPSTRLQPIEAGVSLRILPRIADQGEITIQIEPDISDVTWTGEGGLPEVNRRRVATTVRVQDGQTIAIGGLLQSSRNQVVRKVPVLGDLPILAHLFRSVSVAEEETEVMVFITPRILQT